MIGKITHLSNNMMLVLEETENYKKGAFLNNKIDANVAWANNLNA